MSEEFVDYWYDRDEIVTGDNGETLKILRYLKKESLERDEEVYLVGFQGKIMPMTFNEIGVALGYIQDYIVCNLAGETFWIQILDSRMAFQSQVDTHDSVYDMTDENIQGLIDLGYKKV